MKNMVIKHLVWAAVCGAFASLTTLTAEKAENSKDFAERPVETLENGVVRLVFTSEIGGRILAFEPISGGFNVLQPRYDNLHLEPEDNWAGGDYGGMSDLATPGWPGPFWGQDYRIKSITGGKSPSAIVTAEAEGFGIERRMTLPAGSATAEIEVIQKNVSEAPRSSVIRLHTEMAVGSRARTGDTIYFPGENGVESFTYTIGAEYERFRWLNIHQPWVAIADPVDHAMLIRTFQDQSALPYRLFFWVGAAEAAGELGYGGAFYALDWFGREEALQPGESHRAVETLQLIQGLDRLDFFEDTIAGGLSLQRERAASGTSLRMTAALGSARGLDAHEVLLSLPGPEGKGQTKRLKIEAAAPGKASISHFDWAVPQLGDGSYTLSARFLRSGGQELASTETEITIVNALVREVQESIEELEQASADLFEAPALAGRRESIDVQTERKILADTLNDLHGKMEAGAYEEVIAQAGEAMEHLNKLRQVWSIG